VAGALVCAGSAQAQDPNPGALTVTTGLDFPTTYYFRGLRQEVDPAITMWPYGDLGLALYSGDGGVKSVGVNLGLWNSLHTGSVGSDGPSEKLWYEEDFYTTLTLGFARGLSLGTTYTAYTYPNGGWTNVKELSFKLSMAHRFAPYGLIAFELDNQADGGSQEGTYLELGVGPSWPLADGRATLAIPVKLGMSLSDYYELSGADSSFGFFDIGALLTVPLNGIPSSYGAWNFHAGLDVLALGDTAEAFNVNKDGETSGTGIIGLVGIGLSY
jgi:hypothetical protein